MHICPHIIDAPEHRITASPAREDKMVEALQNPLEKCGMRAFALVCVLTFLGSHAHAFEGGEYQCGRLENPVGPYDYRKDKSLLFNVETNHFNIDVRTLRKGQSSAHIAGDLDYLLRAYPNHPGGLDAIARLYRKTKQERLPGANYSVSCYFDRAIRIAPDDPAVRVLYAHHMWSSGSEREALEQLEIAEKFGIEDANTLYNIGLMRFKSKDHDGALKYAWRAYRLGFPLPGLREMLKKSGHWKEDPEPGNEDKSFGRSEGGIQQATPNTN